jgi:hypothetical protein
VFAFGCLVICAIMPPVSPLMAVIFVILLSLSFSGEPLGTFVFVICPIVFLAAIGGAGFLLLVFLSRSGAPTPCGRYF